ncbi:unnamed protein product [Phytophthora fragariaefolia]|uniref:Unnamed protein product n=1 Tax=Phytophthora fragariaefolia TaxID=1490495 RepID=A0A9W6TWZ0_9STRA|nr:unnamed protein product [Phytophthora fragariaefolia]
MLHGSTLFVAVLLGAANTGPCDIYKAANTPCVAAHSTVRALLDEFTGPMYQVQRASDSTTFDIKPLEAGATADAASQDKFCEGTTCVISIIYDQSGKGNHLTSAPAGGNKPTPDDPANANSLPLTINGQKAYGVWIDAGNGYRNDNTNGIATGDDAEAI